MKNSSLYIILFAMAVILACLLIGFSVLAKKLDKLEGVVERVTKIEAKIDSLEVRVNRIERGGASATTEPLWRSDK